MLLHFDNWTNIPFPEVVVTVTSSTVSSVNSLFFSVHGSDNAETDKVVWADFNFCEAIKGRDFNRVQILSKVDEKEAEFPLIC